MHKVGLYGLSGHTGIILEAIAARDDAVLVAAGTEDALALQSFRASEHVTPDTHFYDGWRDMLENEDITVLAVTSENDRHVDPIVAAAKRGIAVISEKPVAIDRAGFEKVRHAVTEHGIDFSVLFDMRTAGPYIAMKKAVASGAIGKPVLISAQKSYRLGERPKWMKARKTYGGTIPYVGCHMLDLAMWVTDLDVRRVAAFHGNTAREDIAEMEDHAVVTFEMTEGAAMTLTLDFLRPDAAPTHGDARLRIAGSEGVIEVKDLESRVEIVTTGEVPRDVPLGEGYNLFDNFLSSIEGRARHVIKAEEAFRVTEILLGALAAADTGKVVEV